MHPIRSYPKRNFFRKLTSNNITNPWNNLNLNIDHKMAYQSILNVLWFKLILTIIRFLYYISYHIGYTFTLIVLKCSILWINKHGSFILHPFIIVNIIGLLHWNGSTSTTSKPKTRPTNIIHQGIFKFHIRTSNCFWIATTRRYSRRIRYRCHCN